MKKTVWLGAAILCLVTSPSLSAQVVNGGFETGNLTGWTTAGNCGFTGVGSSAARSGGFGLFSGPIGSICTLSQSIATNPGDAYIFSFWLRNTGGPTNVFNARFDGSSVLALSNNNAFDYQEFSFNVTATAASTALEFDFQQNPAFWHMDDVSLSASSVVPEPSSMALMAGGLFGLAAAARRRKNAKV